MRNRSLFLVALMSTVGVAWGHITLVEPSAKAGSYYVATFRVAHGCDGSPTTALRIAIPANVSVARPQPKPGWTLQIEHAAEEAAGQRVSAVTWSGSALPADEFDQFSILLKLPRDGASLAFPAIQSCGDVTVRWSDPPGAGSHTPAPTLSLIAAPMDAMPGMAMPGEAHTR